MALSDKEVVRLVREIASQIDDVRLHYELKRMRIRTLARTREYIKAVMALAHLRLPITAELVAAVAGGKPSPTVTILHNLGDKGLLLFVRARRKTYRWIPTDLLKRLLVLCL